MKIFLKIIALFSALFFLVFTPMVAIKKTGEKRELPIKTETYKAVLTLWNIDSFEGGIGSRTEFLGNVCLGLKDDGILIMTSSYTVDGAKEALKSGAKPDIISFGIGCGFVSDYAKEMENYGYESGKIGDKTYAVPWCVGGYFLISKNEDNRLIEGLILSKGKYNQPVAAAILGGLKAISYEEKEPLSAYTAFLSGDRAMIGTQRDIWRLKRRGVNFVSRPIEVYNDLVQYLSITADDSERYKYASIAVRHILSEAKKKTDKIGMFSTDDNPYDENLGQYDLKKIEYTLSPFTTDENINYIYEMSKDKNGDMAQKLKNVLKHL
ncbi:MAG: hypothetical protein IJ706_04480 [Clostridia bacterium]|nr:hypothetical protein [Clostridia bacterium]